MTISKSKQSLASNASSASIGRSISAIMEQGREVGLLACQLFPGGIEVSGEGGLEQTIRTTQELIASPEAPAIFEGAFENGGVLVRVDIFAPPKRRPMAANRGQIHH
jgi:hypothetical protein